MESGPVIDARLTAVLEELKKREPIFHRLEFGTTRPELEQMTDPGFWEVGASGRRYSRQYVIDTLIERYSAAAEDVWETSEFQCAQLSSDTYLLTYTLLQHRIRVTRRATIWRKASDGWKILYHQGTIVESPEE